MALERYQESLELYTNLAKKHPQVYEIEYARTLFIGAYLSEKNNKNLKEARVILLKYPNVPQAKELLETINNYMKALSNFP